MADDLQNQLARIAAVMNELPADPKATIAYDVASDSLVWSDELPQQGVFRIKELWCLRPILRYRTSLILTTPEIQFRSAWELAQATFPGWIGFQSNRQSPELVATFTHLSHPAKQGINELFK